MKRVLLVMAVVLAWAIVAACCFAGAISELQSEISGLFDKVKLSVPTVVYTIGNREFVSTGIVMDSEGHVLTTKDFAGKATSVEVQFLKEKRKAKLLGYDRESKLTLLKVDGGGLSPVRLGNSSMVKPATWVMIVGNSLGISPSVSTGVISGSRNDDDMFQVSATINPGNSGAGVFNSEGELVGIVSAALARPFYLSLGEGAQKLGASINLLRRGELPMGGSGLVIPSNRAVELMKKIREHGTTTRGWLGVRLQEMDKVTKSSLGVKQGALVSDVVEGSPAEKSGMEGGDVILTYAGKDVAGIKELVDMVGKTKPGQNVSLSVMRQGKRKTLKVKIGERPEEELLSQQWHIEMPALQDFYTATELFKSAEKKELDKEVKKLKEEIKKLKEELQKLQKKGGGL